MHETYEAPRGKWENVYEGFVPIGMGEWILSLLLVWVFWRFMGLIWGVVIRGFDEEGCDGGWWGEGGGEACGCEGGEVEYDEGTVGWG